MRFRFVKNKNFISEIQKDISKDHIKCLCEASKHKYNRKFRKCLLPFGNGNSTSETTIEKKSSTIQLRQKNGLLQQ